jgi:hypothetical protein
VCPNLSPMPLSQLRMIVNLWPGQIPGEGRYNCIRDIRRSYCQPFFACMSIQLMWVHVGTLLIKINCLVKIFSVFRWSVFSTRGSLVPTSLGLLPGFYIPSWKGVPALPRGDASCCLFVGAPKFGWGQQLSRSVNELGLQNLKTQVKELWRQGLWQPRKFCAQTKTRNVMGVTK